MVQYPALGLQWQWHANKQDTYGFTTDLGYYRLYAGSLSAICELLEVPNPVDAEVSGRRICCYHWLTFTAKRMVNKPDSTVMDGITVIFRFAKAGINILQQAVVKMRNGRIPETGKKSWQVYR